MRYFLLLGLCLVSCTTTYPNRDPIGESFPSVAGTSLADKRWELPEDLKGEEVLLLIGYKQNSQFDIDRWLIGLDQTETQVPIFEIPAIQGWFPILIQDRIDAGMKRGIPGDLWKAVITVYEDGEKIQAFTGNTNGNNARVIALNP